MTSRVSDKINDLFLLSISDLETTIVSQIIKLNNNPQKLIEEIQQSLNDYKQKMYSSLIQLIQLISQLSGQNNKDVKQMAEVLEQQILHFQQTHLLYQMKALINQKIKALFETLNYSSLSTHRKQEIEKQVQQLSDSLHKIEENINQSSGSSPNVQINQYITPGPRREQVASFSDSMTPNLSEDAEKKARVQFITPDQVKIQVVNTIQNSSQASSSQPFEQHHFSLETSIMLNKTLNSFNNDHQAESRIQVQNHMEQLIKNAFQDSKIEDQLGTLPQFGVCQQNYMTGQKLIQSQEKIQFQNEFMNQCLESNSIKQTMLSDRSEAEQNEICCEVIMHPLEKIQPYPLEKIQPYPLEKIQPYPLEKVQLQTPQTVKELALPYRRISNSIPIKLKSSASLHRKVSVQSLQSSERTPINMKISVQSLQNSDRTPSNIKNTMRCSNSTNAKKIKRKNSSIESIPQLSYSDVIKETTNPPKLRENKENMVLNLKKPQEQKKIAKKCTTIVMQKTNGIIKPAYRQK